MLCFAEYTVISAVPEILHNTFESKIRNDFTRGMT